MFRRKKDVDRHVSCILARIRDEKERNGKGYQIARLYFEVKEYETARRYLANYLTVWETVPQAYRLLGQIEESVGNKENAVEAYKRFLEMGGSGKDVVLKICELYGDIGVDPGVGKYWLEKAEQLHPQNDVIFRLKEKLITASPGHSSDSDLENLIVSELVKKPQDVELRVKLLRLYLESNRVEEAYTNAVDTEHIMAFTSCMEWYECLYDVFRAYESESDVEQNVDYLFHYLVVLCNLSYLRLTDKDVVESAEALHSFDLTVQRAIRLNHPSEQWQAFITEMQGQLFFMAGTLLLKRSQKGSVTWSDMCPLAATLYLLCQTVPTVDAQATWFVRPSQNREKIFAWLYNSSFFRISQTGHSLYQLCHGETGPWVQRLQKQCCTPPSQERLYEALFPIRDMRNASARSFLFNTHAFCNTPLTMPLRRQLYDVDRVAHTFHPDRLSELVWLCLQQYSFDSPHQPDYNFKTFETLTYSVKNMGNGAAESLCQLDCEAFLYATVRCTALLLKEQQLSMEGDVLRPPMLPLCLCKKLCTSEQDQWWKTVHSFYSNTIKENFIKLRHILQRGIEVVRLVGNHGMSSAMVVHLAKTFDAKVKSLTEGDHGNRGSANQLACLEARAAFYWRQALDMLSRPERHQQGPQVKVRLFNDGDDGDLTPMAKQEMMQDAKFACATIAMREGHYEDAVRDFERLTTPYASFYRAQIYKSMAQKELEGSGPEEVRRHRYTALIAQAREALYLTMDYLGGNKNHELNILLTRELDDVESKLNCFEWENEDSQREDSEELLMMKTPVKNPSMVHHTHSTPKSPSHTVKNVKHRLLLSELTADGSSQSRPFPTSAHAEIAASSSSTQTRPSPERLDAQIKSINYSQSQLFKMVLDRNEELAGMYQSLVSQLQDSSAELKTALTENKRLMEELKGVLAANKESMSSLKDSVQQLKEEFQTSMTAAATSTNMLSAQGLAASQINAAASYFMGSPYHPSQYPPYPQPLNPGHPGYRYPLLPGYPPRPVTPVAPPPAAASVPVSTARLSGTAPSNFGKFRGSDHQSVVDVMTTEDEDDDEENGLSACGSEYGEGLLQTPGAQYFLHDGSTGVADWMAGSHHVSTGPMGGVYPGAPSQPSVPQPGYFASAMKGQALQFSSPAMPGPGFFSFPSSASQPSAIVSALGAKSPHQPALSVTTSQPQPIPVIGAGSSKSTAFPASRTADSTGLVVLFQDNAKLTTSSGDIPALDVRVIQDSFTKQGSIVVRKKDSQEIVVSHNIAMIKVIPSFTHTFFLWTIATSGERKLEETFRLTLDSAEQVKKLRGAIEQVVKSAGIKPPPSPAAPVSPAFCTKSPTQQPSPHTTPKEGAQPGFQISTQPLFSSLKTPIPGKSPGGKEEEGVEEYEPNVDFKPIIDLPDLVEVRTGEEDETKVFSDRLKLFRFDSESSQWKERGIGELKILKSGENIPRFRILMRREQVLKVCANHYISVDMKLTPLSASDRAWCYTAHDYAEEEMKMEKFAVKFKNLDKAAEFKVCFENCQREITAGKAASKSAILATSSAPAAKNTDKPDNQKPLSELFKPEVGSWECPGCYISNKGTVQHCVACNTRQPGLAAKDTTPTSTTQAVSTSTFGGFKFGSQEASTAGSLKSMFGGSGAVTGGGFKFGSTATTPTTTITTSATATAAATTSAASTGQKQVPLSELFKPEAGSWECPGCYISNKGMAQCCVACNTQQPGLAPNDATRTSTTTSTSQAANTNALGGFKFGSQGGGDANSDGNKPATPPASGGFNFGSSPAPLSSESGGFGFPAPAAKTSEAVTSSTAPKAGMSSESGFKFPAPAAKLSEAVTSSTAPKAGMFRFNLGTTTTAAFGTQSPATTAAPASTASTTHTDSSSATAKAAAGFTFGDSKPDTAEAASASPAGFSFAAAQASKDSAWKDSGFSFAMPQAPSTQKAEPCSGLLQQLLMSDDQQEAIQKPSLFGSSPASASNSAMPSGFQARLGQVTSPSTETNKDGSQKGGFQFTFSLQKQQQQPTTPKSPDVDEQGFYLNKDGEDSHIYFEPVVSLPEKIDMKTGEEDEEVLFESRAKLYRFLNKEWKERGLGVLRILQHRDTGRIRLLMRRDQVLKICCNHFITEDLDLKPMSSSDGKAWIWYAMDFTDGEGKMEQFAIRFRDADLAGNFKKVFDESREKMKTPSKANAKMLDPLVVNSAEKPASGVVRKLFHIEEEDDSVVFLFEETPTQEQVARARRVLLPDSFFLYENRPGCPGCIGCEDYDPTKSPTALAPKKEKSKALISTSATPTQALQEEAVEKAKDGSLFGAVSGMSFSALAASSGDTPAFGAKDPSKPFHWAGAGQKLFGGGGMKGEEEKEEEEGEVTTSDDIHFEPVIPLPDLVEVKTGEEDWTTLFVHRAKVYRFDSGQWKERGIGEMKIMKHISQLQFRVLLRREQVLKVACNHLITSSMELKPLHTSETAWCWVATDYTDSSHPNVQQFAVKFKNQEIAKDFKAVFEECQKQLRESEQREPVQETLVSSTAYPTGDRGNVQHTQAIRIEAQDTITPVSQPVTGDGGDAEEQYDDEEYDDEDEEEEEDNSEEEDEEERVEFERRVTMFRKGDQDQWEKLGMGLLRVLYDDDLNANKLLMVTDNEEKVCNHIITMELTVSIDEKKKSCEWQPIDFATDEPICRHFKAYFSSLQAAEEFASIFRQGQKLAAESGVSAKLPEELEVPEVFSTGDRSEGSKGKN